MSDGIGRDAFNLTDVTHHIAQGLQAGGGLFRNRELEAVFDRHDDLHEVQGVRFEVVLELGCQMQLIGLNRQLSDENDPDLVFDLGVGHGQGRWAPQ